MKYNLGIDNIEAPLRTKIKLYKKKAQKFEKYLSKHPDEWGKFQNEFNAEVNGIFRNIMNFEKINLAKGNEDKVYKLKRLFINEFRPIFAKGEYNVWTLQKPFGYAGDFKIIDDIYQNNPTTIGYERLFDNYFQMSATAVAVRNRKEDLKRFLAAFIKGKNNNKLRIMDLASGSCRDLKELLCMENVSYENVIFDCYDNDERALKFGRKLLAGYENINFFKKNAIKIALKKSINLTIDKEYDCIFSAGLFDYFDERVAAKLVQNLKKLLKPEGRMFIANVRDKYCSPSIYFLEWGGDWNLVYRDEEEFTRIFRNAGFAKNKIELKYEQQGIVQYIIASQ